MRASIRWVILGAALSFGFGASQPSLRVSGGITLNGTLEPLLFTWNSAVPITGSGWAAGEPVRILLREPRPLVNPLRTGTRMGPRLEGSAVFAPISRRGMHHPPVAQSRAEEDIVLGVFNADSSGNLIANPVIPFDGGMVGPQVRIPRPGYYEVIATGPVSGTVAAVDSINLAPDTYTGPGGAAFDWGHDRGGRDGVFPGPLRQYSPERFDPEWPTVWDERPVAAYGTIAPPDANTGGQPSQISYTDNPATHYGHDANYFVVPDAPYRWLVGTANYYTLEADSPGPGRLEVEWETLNAGNPSSYGQGQIGVPIWANPTVGDRVYVVGRWIVDAGHPEIGDRTEIHAPRLVATMRSRPVVWNGSAASTVDIYVSGHGGGANWMPPGLSMILDQGGHGGGRIRDVLSPSDQDRYYRAGPLNTLLYPLVVQVVKSLTGISISAPVYADAGPSAFPWGGPGPELRPVNDMDYDIDVPLPPAPPGSTALSMNVVTHAEHTTAVNEFVSYSGPSSATVAHIHLPYRGADNGIYARSITFVWNQAPAPSSHWIVRLNRIDVVDVPGKWNLWADVSGQWTYLTGVAPGLLKTTAGTGVALPGTPQDVYLNPGQTIRVQVQGYGAACLDDFFGKLFGESSYAAGLTFVGQCGPTDNQDLGAAVLELPAVPASAGSYTVAAMDAGGNHHFSVELSVEQP